MRIVPTGPPTVTLPGRPGRGRAASFAPATRSDSAAGPTRASGPAPLTSLAGVLAAQQVEAVEDVAERRRRALRRAERLLDLLDELRRGLLEGRLSAGLGVRLQAVLQEARAAVEDPKLEAVLQEVELRAAVEAAKLERARAELSGDGEDGGAGPAEGATDGLGATGGR